MDGQEVHKGESVWKSTCQKAPGPSILSGISHTVPGTSPTANYRGSVLRSQMTMGSRHWPPALTQPTTVTCDFNPLERVFFVILPVIIFRGLGSSGMPVSSMLNIWQGLSISLLSSKVDSSSSKQMSTFERSDAPALAVERVAGVCNTSMGFLAIKAAHHPDVTCFTTPREASTHSTIAMTSCRVRPCPI